MSSCYVLVTMLGHISIYLYLYHIKYMLYMLIYVCVIINIICIYYNKYNNIYYCVKQSITTKKNQVSTNIPILQNRKAWLGKVCYLPRFTKW